MFLIEPIDVLNKRLIDHFGIDTFSNQPIWRIVFSEDQLEKQLCEHSAGGILLLRPEVIEVPKYRQWITKKYILEQLVIVPDYQQREVADSKVSYEPFYVFADKNDNYLPPKWEVAEILIATSLAVRGKSSLARYSDGINSQEDEIAARKKRINDMVEYFGGDESGLMGASLDSGNAAFVPHNYEKSN